MPRGGKREGAGRTIGALTKKTRAVAERAMAEGKSPLEVMLDNMRYFQQVALDAEAVIENMTAGEIGGEPAEQFKMLLAEVKKAAGLRIMAHECARDAAPFLHPRLSSTEVKGDVAVAYVVRMPARPADITEWHKQHAPPPMIQ